MEDTDKPTRRRSSKARPDPAAVPITEPLPDLLAGLPKQDEPAPATTAKPARKRAPARKTAPTTPPASAAMPPAETASAADATVPALAIVAASLDAATAAPAAGTLRSPATERVARPTAAAMPAPVASTDPAAVIPVALPEPTDTITTANIPAVSTAVPPPQNPPVTPALPTLSKRSVPSAPAAMAASAPASPPKSAAPTPRPRKPAAARVEVQDALALPQAPPWSTDAQAAIPLRSAVLAARPADASTRSMRAIEALLRVLPERHRARWRDYLVLMRMDRPVGALLLLWPTWWALWFAAKGMPSLALFAIFTVGVFVMRAAGCVINDYADHDWLDANVERTRGRPMAAGRVSRKEALLLFGGLLLIAFALVLFTNPLTVALSFAGAALAAIYPFAKRVTHLAQVVLGAAFGWSIPMAFASTLGEVPALGWLLFLANVLFSVIYDTQYAMVDRDEDIRVGAKSTAILFGDADRAILGVLMLSFVITLLLAGSRADLAWPWTAGVAVAAVLFGWQQSLIRERDRAGCFAAFRNNNWVGFVIWLGLVAALLVGRATV